MKVSAFVKACLRGSAQIVFSADTRAGFLILIAIAYGSLQGQNFEMLLGFLLGLFISTATAVALSRLGKNSEKVASLFPNAHDLELGLTGYNGALIGIALPVFFAPTVLMWIAITGFSALSVPAAKLGSFILDKFKLPVLTAPFVLITWLCFAVFQFDRTVPTTASSARTSLSTSLIGSSPEVIEMIASSFFKGFSQIFLIENSISGFLILMALFITAKPYAYTAAMGAFIGTLSGIFSAGSYVGSSNGLWGYNPALTALAVGTVFLSHNRSLAATLVGSGITVLIGILISPLVGLLSWPVLTAPFVAGTWITLSLFKVLLTRKVVPS